MVILEFTTKKKSNDGRPYKLAIPVRQIKSLETVWGGERVDLKVNGIEVCESYIDVLKTLSESEVD